MVFERDKMSYYSGLPRKRSATGVLIFKENKILVLEPTYKPNWVIPGGVVESCESPLEASARECLEEIGLNVKIDSLLCIDYKRGNKETGDAIHFLFLGSIGNDDEIQLNKIEIKSCHWMSIDEALKKFDTHLSSRVKAGQIALESARVVYCHDGEILL